MWKPIAALSVLVLSAVAGCAHDPVHQIDMQVDCANICARYRDCFDANYNTSACENRCHDMVNNDPNSANACDACLDGHSCTGSFACASECQGILP